MASKVQNLDISRLETAYSDVLFARRICQLYFFMLVFEMLLNVYNFGMDLLNWMLSGFSQDQASQLIEFSQFEPGIVALALAILGIAWLLYYIYSSFRPAWWALALCFAALLVNVYVGFINAGTYEMEWAQEAEADLTWAQQLVPYLYMAGLIPLHIYFFGIAVKGQMAIHGLTEDERALLSEYHDTPRPFLDAAKSLANVPEAIRYAKGRIWSGALMVFAGVANFMNFWRVAIVFIFICLLPIIALMLFPNIGQAFTALAEGRSLGRVISDLVVVAIILAFYLGIVMLIPWAIGKLARLSVRRAENRMRNSLEGIQHKDDRAPILFLRSFLNDAVPIAGKTQSLKHWLLDGAGAQDTLDMMILAEGTRLGPTVALGNPDDPAPPYGVARGYFDHSDWKEAVMGLCERSAAIILVLDQTEGVEWEIGHIAARKYVCKTLFLLAPEDIGTERGNRLLGNALARATKADVSEMSDLLTQRNEEPAMGFMLADDAPQLLTVTKAKQYAYLAAIRRFFRLLPANFAKEIPSGASDET
ncbi:MAG: hypothetical protein ABJP34_10475 [Erythrobacter sp.]